MSDSDDSEIFSLEREKNNQGINRISLTIIGEDGRALNWFWYPGEEGSRGLREGHGSKSRATPGDIRVSQARDSKLQDLLSRNLGTISALPKEDVTQLDAFRSRTEAEVRALQQQSREAILSIEALCQKINEIDLEISLKYQQTLLANSLQSPIRRLPSEILSYVFELLVAKDRGRHQVQLRLMLVCKWWRTLVSENLALWDRLHLAFPYHGSSRTYLEQTYDKLVTRLGIVVHRLRVNERALALYVVDENPQDIEDLEDDLDGSITPAEIQSLHDHAIDRILTTLPVCRSFSICATHPMWIEKLGIWASVQLPMLQSINLDYRGSIPDNLSIAFTHSPRLTSAAVTWPSSSISTRLTLPFGQLRHINTSISAMGQDMTQSFWEWRELLSLCPNIQSAEVLFSCMGDNRPTQSPGENRDKEIATGIESLVIQCNSDASLEEVISGLGFSSLKALYLTAASCKFRFAPYEVPIPEFLERNHSSFSLLTHLSVIRIEIETPDLFLLLRTLKGLESLDILYGEFGKGKLDKDLFFVQDSEIVDFLAISDSNASKDTVVLPNLRHIRLYDGQMRRGVYPAQQAFANYANMAKTRYSWAVKLRQIQGQSELPQEDESRRSFEGSPFQFNHKVEATRFLSVGKQIEKAIGPLHKRIFHAEVHHSANARNDDRIYSGLLVTASLADS